MKNENVNYLMDLVQVYIDLKGLGGGGACRGILAGKFNRHSPLLKGLSHEIDFKNVVENGQILALIRAAAGF